MVANQPQTAAEAQGMLARQTYGDGLLLTPTQGAVVIGVSAGVLLGPAAGEIAGAITLRGTVLALDAGLSLTGIGTRSLSAGDQLATLATMAQEASMAAAIRTSAQRAAAAAAAAAASESCK